MITLKEIIKTPILCANCPNQSICKWPFGGDCLLIEKTSPRCLGSGALYCNADNEPLF